MLWTKELNKRVFGNSYYEPIVIEDINQDGIPELLLPGIMLNARNGDTLKTDTSSGTVADLNQDGNLEIVTSNVILDSDFNQLSVREDQRNFVNYWGGDSYVDRDHDYYGEYKQRYHHNLPIVKDINSDGQLEIILYDYYGIYVYDSHYSPLWSYNSQGVKQISVGDLDNSGLLEIALATIKLEDKSSVDKVELTIFKADGSILWQDKRNSSGLNFEMLLNDINNDQNLDLIIAEGRGDSWRINLTAYTAKGQELWRMKNSLTKDWDSLVIADVDGDKESEIIAKYDYHSAYCIDNLVKRQTSKSLAVPTETEVFEPNLSWPQAVVLSDGSLWMVDNQESGITYYDPTRKDSGVISINSAKTKNNYLGLRRENNSIEVWDLINNQQLGIINTYQKTFREENNTGNKNRIYNDSHIHNGCGYYMKYFGGVMQDIYKENFSTGKVKRIGRAKLGTGINENLIKVIDNKTALVSKGQDSNVLIGTLSLSDFKFKPLKKLTDIKEIKEYNWLDKETMLFKRENREDDYKDIANYNYRSNQVRQVLSKEEIKNYLTKQGFEAEKIDFEFIVKDKNSLYIICYKLATTSDIFFKAYPHLLEYNIVDKRFIKRRKLKKEGFISSFAKKKEDYYYTLAYDNRVYYYNQNTGERNSFEPPQNIKRLISEKNLEINDLFYTDNNKVYLYCSNYYSNNHDVKKKSDILIELDLITRGWQQINLGDNIDYDVKQIELDSSGEKLYFIAYDGSNLYLGEYDLSFNSHQELNVVEGSKYMDSQLYLADNKLYYRWDKYDGGVRYFDLEMRTTEKIDVPLPESNDGWGRNWSELIGVKDDSLYFIKHNYISNRKIDAVYDAVDSYDYYSNNLLVVANLVKYSIKEDEMTLLSSIQNDERIKEIHADYQSNHYFDADTLKYYSGAEQNILEYNLEKIEIPIADNSIYESSDKVIEEVVAEKTIPLSLAKDENRSLYNDFDLLEQPGSYKLSGTVVNDNNQVLAKDSYNFYVSDNGLGIAARTDKDNYQLGDSIEFAGDLINGTDKFIKGLKFKVSRKIKGKKQILKEEEFSLRAGENRNFNLFESVEEIGEYLLKAELIHDGKELAKCMKKVEVTKANIETEIKVPKQVGSKKFPATVKITNTSQFPIEIGLSSDLMEISKNIKLEAKETRYIKENIKINSSQKLLVNVSGDINKSYSQDIEFVEDAKLNMNLGKEFPAATDQFYYTLKNTGKIDAQIPVKFRVYRNGSKITEKNYSYYLEATKSLSGSLELDLKEGQYRIEYSTPYNSGEAKFTSLAPRDAKLAAEFKKIGPNKANLRVDIENTGFEKIDGELKIYADFLQRNKELNLSRGENCNDVITLKNLPLKEGEYKLKLILSNSKGLLTRKTITFVQEKEVKAAADMRIRNFPSDLVVGAGQEVKVPIIIENVGAVSGDAIVEFVCEGIDSYSKLINLESGTKEELTFNLAVPEDFESRKYPVKVAVNGKVSTFKYQVEGYKIKAQATLDKKNYIKGETATLILEIENIGGQSGVPLLVRTKHGDFDKTKEIILGREQKIGFKLPAKDFKKKIFYGFYHKKTGRSLFLNVHNIRQAHPEFKAIVDKQVYRPGEIINLDVEVNQKDELIVMGPGGFKEVNKGVSDDQSYQILVPKTLKTGTYDLLVALGDKSVRHNIEVLGHNVSFVQGKLDKDSYQNGDSFELETLIDSKDNSSGKVVLELIKPNEKIKKLATKEVELETGENHISFSKQINSKQLGRHWFRVKFITDKKESIMQGKIPFQVGQIELINIMTKEQRYPQGTEKISGEVLLRGKGEGIVNIYLDGKQVKSINVTIDGTTVIPYQLGGVQPKYGKHQLSARYEGKNKTAKVKTKFDYGTGLADFRINELKVKRERNNQGQIPIKIKVEKLRDLAAKNIPVEVRVAEQIISNYTIKKLTMAKSIDQRVVYWDSGTYSGDAEIEVEVNPKGSKKEYNKEKNLASKKIFIPSIPKVDKLPQGTNNQTLTISGQASSDSLISLYRDGEIIDFAYTNDDAEFSLDDFKLLEGKNKFRLEAEGQTGWKSKLTEEFKVILDTAKPKVQINNVVTGRYYQKNVTPEIVIEESHSQQEIIQHNDQDWEVQKITTEGFHQIKVKVIDVGGQTTQINKSFSIDKTKPEIKISGISDGGAYDQPITPEIIVTDKNLMEEEILLDGSYYVQGRKIKEEGEHQLTVIARDKAGNKEKENYHFSINSGPKLEIKNDFGRGLRTLVLGDKEDQSCGYVVNNLKSRGITVNIAENVSQFIAGVESNQYNLYLILDNRFYQELFEDTNGLPLWSWRKLMLRRKVKELLEEKVAKGASMLYIFDRDHYENFFYFTLLNDLIGAEFEGFLDSKEWKVETTDLIEPNLWFEGKALKTEVTSGQTKATVSYKRSIFNPWEWSWKDKEEKTSVIINNQYKQGEVYSLTFDPTSLLEEQDKEAEMLFDSILNNLRPEDKNYLKTESLFSLELGVKNINNQDMKLKYVLRLPDSFKAVDSTNYQVKDNQISQEFSLEKKDEVKSIFFAISAADVGDYQLQPKLYYSKNGEWKLYKKLNLECELR